jgi:hypothetical protein
LLFGVRPVHAAIDQFAGYQFVVLAMMLAAPA